MKNLIYFLLFIFLTVAGCSKSGEKAAPSTNIDSVDTNKIIYSIRSSNKFVYTIPFLFSKPEPQAHKYKRIHKGEKFIFGLWGQKKVKTKGTLLYPDFIDSMVYDSLQNLNVDAVYLVAQTGRWLWIVCSDGALAKIHCANALFPSKKDCINHFKADSTQREIREMFGEMDETSEGGITAVMHRYLLMLSPKDTISFVYWDNSIGDNGLFLEDAVIRSENIHFGRLRIGQSISDILALYGIDADSLCFQPGIDRVIILPPDYIDVFEKWWTGATNLL